jgi:hypothetical protein
MRSQRNEPVRPCSQSKHSKSDFRQRSVEPASRQRWSLPVRRHRSISAALPGSSRLVGSRVITRSSVQHSGHHPEARRARYTIVRVSVSTVIRVVFIGIAPLREACSVGDFASGQDQMSLGGPQKLLEDLKCLKSKNRFIASRRRGGSPLMR